MDLEDILRDFDSGEGSEVKQTPLKEKTMGPYTLEEKLGEGAFSKVWRAHQSSPIKRDVALKILKIGMDTGEILVRFEQERQTLALMDHPNIAAVFDAGATKKGRPYFVMELVLAKEHLTSYCEDRNLSFEKRIELFREVCLAIQHAHQKGIIHRDLKPSNILVSADSPPRLKVIDFGISKVVANEFASDRSLVTQMGLFMGTPPYMSPEQLASSRDVDTRSDVYSMGVILYELLAGVRPFEVDSRERPAVTQKPSLAATGERGPQLRGDLDCIILKCLELDRKRRYQSSAELLAEIDRYLANQPILARPPERWYLAQQYFKRNRTSVVAAAALMVALLGALLITGNLFQKEQRALEQALLENKQNDEVVRVLNETIASAKASQEQGEDSAMRRALLQDALERLEKNSGLTPQKKREVRQLLTTSLLELKAAPATDK